jgi:hypothetical protein
VYDISNIVRNSDNEIAISRQFRSLLSHDRFRTARLSRKRAIWILVLFLLYTTVTEFNTLFGHGELFKIFFTRRSSQLKLTRRQRIRTLVELDRLTEAHGVSQLRDPTTAAHAEMVGLISDLAARRQRS